ncbi:MAG: hypothetical protein KDL87_13190, partial [Verrucomicrobiae bacterium]|nr:hypothetical protein [Verrucomicrobiae bacterium]
MDEERSTIGNSLGVSVFGLLLGLSALSFLATYLTGGPGAAFAPVEPKPEPPVAVETPSHPPVEVVMAQLAETQKVEKALRSELETLKRETGDTTGEIERLKQEKAALGKELTVTSGDLDSFKVRLTETQSKIEAAEMERSAVSAELETIRASTRGEVSRLKGELQSMKRKAEDDAKNWEANRIKLESAAENLEQQNELLKT